MLAGAATAVFRELKGLMRVNYSPLLVNQFFNDSHRIFGRQCSTESQEEERDQLKEENVTSTRDPKDRSVKIPVETSIRYMNSRAYASAYGNEPVWVPYRRNFRGHIAPKATRSTCIRQNRLISNNPCPICRDEFLVLHETNVDLLKQFISPYTGEVLPVSQTGICQKQFDNLMVVLLRAWDGGYLTHDVPFREYDYSMYDPYSRLKH